MTREEFQTECSAHIESETLLNLAKVLDTAYGKILSTVQKFDDMIIDIY